MSVTYFKNLKLRGNNGSDPPQTLKIHQTAVILIFTWTFNKVYRISFLFSIGAFCPLSNGDQNLIPIGDDDDVSSKVLEMNFKMCLCGF